MSDKLSLEVQSDDIAEAVRARYTMVASILRAMLYSSHGPTVKALGGPAAITLEQLARIYQEGSGEYGICFEYALHDSIRARHKLYGLSNYGMRCWHMRKSERASKQARTLY